jgi:LmbE family N-acetylglucosaminyl deacetylase
MSRTLRILFAVCHADDEAMWVGALLHGLSHIEGVETIVACLSGAGPRSEEFEAAARVAGYTRGTLLDLPLRPALEPLPETSGLLEDALRRLELGPGEIDLLVTHSPYGDEHLHPHHEQAHRQLRRWSAERDVPFAFFTSASSPFILHRSVSSDLRRSGSLHFVQFARTYPTPRGLLLPPASALLARARWFAQFVGDAEVKRRMLECYASVDQHVFRDGYAMYTNPAESLYLADDRGASVIRALAERMEAPSPVDLFAASAPTASIVSASRRRVGQMLGRGGGD